jgi:hypothetical protein
MDEDRSPWTLIDNLREDAFVQIIERPSIAADPRLAKAIGVTWLRYSKDGYNMEALMRLATRRLRARGELYMFSRLDDSELLATVDKVFSIASLLIRE